MTHEPFPVALLDLMAEVRQLRASPSTSPSRGVLAIEPEVSHELVAIEDTALLMTIVQPAPILVT